MSLVSPALHWDRSHFDRDDGISALASTPPDARSLPPANRGEVEVAFCLRHAGMRTLRLRYESVGAAGLPVVLVAGGISADRHLAPNAVDDAAGWWPSQVGEGRALAGSVRGGERQQSREHQDERREHENGEPRGRRPHP